MKQIPTSFQFVTGTGSGSTSCRVVSIVSANERQVTELSNYSDSELLDKQRASGEMIIKASGDIYGTYSEIVTVALTPGEFYIGDRRYYVYNNKITFFTHAEPFESGDIRYRVQLPDYPDGGWYINYFNATVPAGIGSPIVVERYPSGELSSRGIIFDAPISSLTGYGDQMGYRTRLVEVEESGEVTYVEEFVEGEDSGAPFVFSPLQRFQLLDSWHDSAIIKPETYTYDFETNSILFREDANVASAELAISYEVRNEPFLVPLNFSPKVRRPRDGIVCISAENGDMNVSSIELSVSQHAPDEVCFARVFTLSDRGLEVGNVEIEAELCAICSVSGETLQVPYTVLGETKYALYDVPASGALTMRGTCLCDTHVAEVSGYGEGIIFFSVGEIAPLDTYGRYMSGELVTTTAVSTYSNDEGIASFFITPPRAKFSYARGIIVRAGEYTEVYEEDGVPGALTPICYATEFVNTSCALIPASELVIVDDHVAFVVPDTILVPSAITYAPLVSGLATVLTGVSPFQPPHHFAVSGSVLYCCLNDDVTLQDDVIIRFPVPMIAAYGDGRTYYYDDRGVPILWEG